MLYVLVICYTLLGYDTPKSVQSEMVLLPRGSTAADCEDVSKTISLSVLHSGKVSRFAASCVAVALNEERTL